MCREADDPILRCSCTSVPMYTGLYRMEKTINTGLYWLLLVSLMFPHQHPSTTRPSAKATDRVPAPVQSRSSLNLGLDSSLRRGGNSSETRRLTIPAPNAESKLVLRIPPSNFFATCSRDLRRIQKQKRGKGKQVNDDEPPKALIPIL